MADESVAEVTGRVEGGPIVCTGQGPMCEATEHITDAVCRPDDACWTFGKDGIAAHVSHNGACWHEVKGTANGHETYIQKIIAEPRSVAEAVSSEGDMVPEEISVTGGSETSSPSNESLSFVSLRDELYQKLRDEGNPPQLSITLATLYAEWKLADVPETMGLLRALLGQLSGFFGAEASNGGFLSKVIGKAMKGNG